MMNSNTGPIALAFDDYSNTVRAMPANYLAADLSHIDASLWGREGEIGQMMAAAPVMLAALRLAADALSPARNGEEADALRSIQSAIAAATGSPAPAQSPPVDSDGKRTDTWNLVPGAQPDADEPEGLATYRITETVVYLVKAEDEAHAERRFVCEVGIHADCFHASEGRTIELEDEGDEFTCTACGRAEDDCSADPCEAVIADRES